MGTLIKCPTGMIPHGDFYGGLLLQILDRISSAGLTDGVGLQAEVSLWGACQQCLGCWVCGLRCVCILVRCTVSYGSLIPVENLAWPLISPGRLEEPCIYSQPPRGGAKVHNSWRLCAWAECAWALGRVCLGTGQSVCVTKQPLWCSVNSSWFPAMYLFIATAFGET